MWWVTVAWAEPAEPGSSLPLVRDEVPEERLYEKVVDLGDGRVEGRTRRRRDAEVIAWELPTSGTIVRYQQRAAGRIAEEHLFDAAGYPLATVWFDKGRPSRAVVAGVPPIELPLTGWAPHEVPGGTALLPRVPEERPGGGARLDLLEGTLDIWIELDPTSTPSAPPESAAAAAAPPAPLDPFSDAFRDGLLAGCGCFVVDRASAWVDGRPGVRYRMLLPGNTPRDAIDLWAVPTADGLWLMSFKVRGPADPVDALRPARAVLATVDLKGGR